MRSCCSGGEGRRVGGPAADDADGPLELDPVRVDTRLGRGPADQGRQGVVGEQVAVDLLADHVRALGPQHPPGTSQGRLELGIPGLMLPALMVGLREQGCRGRRHLGDRGDQRDQLTLPVAVAAATFLGERYSRIARRRGKAKAQVAVARSILVSIWHLLADPAARYTDLGYGYYQARTDTDRKLKNHIRQIQALGFDVTITRAA